MSNVLIGRRERIALLASRLVVAVLLWATILAAPADSKSSGAPQRYRVDFATSRGHFVVDITRAQAPNGADRLYDLLKQHYFDGARFYRVVPGFVVQWGFAADPVVSRRWNSTIADDPVRATNARGTITFAATSEPNSRSAQLFINYANNARLDALGFAPLGKVIRGMNVVDGIYAGYGGNPDQSQIAQAGNAYLSKEFPRLDYIKTARIVSVK
jgi:peptidyl-prolyl cis-trans isomerase A (cyclophilin A)